MPRAYQSRKDKIFSRKTRPTISIRRSLHNLRDETLTTVALAYHLLALNQHPPILVSARGAIRPSTKPKGLSSSTATRFNPFYLPSNDFFKTLPWSAIRQTVLDLDSALTKTGNRIDTANQRGDQLSWQNHKEWYLKRVRKVRSLHRKLKRTLRDYTLLSEILEDMQDPLSTICDIDSSTEAKSEKFQTLSQKWDDFRDALDNTIKNEHDIFRERDIQPDEELCFVLMPFDKKFNSLYIGVIKRAAKIAGLKCRRADDIFSANMIVQDVWTSINKARVIIAEMTDRNPNVFYEIGLAHTLRQPVILISQKKGDIPFDVRHIRCIFYADTRTGKRKLLTNLVRTIRSFLK